MRLYRHPVALLELAEPESRHDRHHRRAGGLVPADLETGRVLPDPVGVVHDRGGQPQQPLLDRAQHIGLRLARHDRHVLPSWCSPALQGLRSEILSDSAMMSASTARRPSPSRSLAWRSNLSELLAGPCAAERSGPAPCSSIRCAWSAAATSSAAFSAW